MAMRPQQISLLDTQEHANQVSKALARSHKGWSAKPTPPPLQPPDGQSLLAGAMCVKMMAGIAGIAI